MSAKKSSGRANQQSNNAVHSEARTRMVRWLHGALTPQEKKEFDDQLEADEAFARQFIQFIFAEHPIKDAAAGAGRTAAATAPAMEHCLCELDTCEPVSEREILFLRYLDGTATPKDIEVLNAELKADPAFKKEVAQTIFSAMMLREIFGDRPLEGGIKRRRSHGPAPSKVAEQMSRCFDLEGPWRGVGTGSGMNKRIS